MFSYELNIRTFVFGIHIRRTEDKLLLCTQLFIVLWCWMCVCVLCARSHSIVTLQLCYTLWKCLCHIRVPTLLNFFVGCVFSSSPAVGATTSVVYLFSSATCICISFPCSFVVSCRARIHCHRWRVSIFLSTACLHRVYAEHIAIRFICEWYSVLSGTIIRTVLVFHLDHFASVEKRWPTETTDGTL